jgi:adenine-specific DNA-methyltransferase
MEGDPAMAAVSQSFNYAHPLHTVHIVQNAHPVHRSRVQTEQRCNCINFGRATDPPYNTGNDFIYRDDFAQSSDEFQEQMGVFDEETGERLFRNTDSNGRFHSDWCSMIYSRLMLARNLLTDDGVIAISIDDNEIANICKICDEVFGSQNFISRIIIQNNPRGRQSDSFVATVHEYLVLYAKSAVQCIINGMQLTDEQKSEYSYSDENGAYRLLGLRQRGVASLREDRPDMFFPVYVNASTLEISLVEKDGWEVVVPKKSDGREGRWMWGKAKCEVDKQRLVPRLIERRGEFDIFVKDYLNRGDNSRTRKYKTIWDDKCINNQVGTQEVKKLLEGDYMSFPKSRAYIQMICQMLSSKNDIILDFFSGSATTAHAVMQLNADDEGQRKFIMVQLPEQCDEKSEAYKAGYRTICDIGKERIRRAGKKIKEESPLTTLNLDTGFRVFKLDDTNMTDVYYSPAEYSQNLLSMLESNVKPDRTDLDLLFGCILEWGLPLSLPYISEQIEGCTVHNYNDGDLIACFDENVPDSVIKEIAKKQPLRAVFRDSSFANSPSKINVGEIFKLLAPDTRVKVI